MATPHFGLLQPDPHQSWLPPTQPSTKSPTHPPTQPPHTTHLQPSNAAMTAAPGATTRHAVCAQSGAAAARCPASSRSPMASPPPPASSSASEAGGHSAARHRSLSSRDVSASGRKGSGGRQRRRREPEPPGPSVSRQDWVSVAYGCRGGAWRQHRGGVGQRPPHASPTAAARTLLPKQERCRDDRFYCRPAAPGRTRVLVLLLLLLLLLFLLLRMELLHQVQQLVGHMRVHPLLAIHRARL